MADGLIDADTMARLSAMMRRAPAGQPSIPGMQPVPSPALSPNPYNTEFPDYIGNPPPTELPPVYNTEFSDLVGRPPQVVPDAVSEWPPLPPRSTRGPYETDYDNSGLPEAVENELLGRFLPPQERAAHRTFGSSFNPGGSVPPSEFGAAGGALTFPNPDKTARIEQLIRDMQEQEELEARLRAMGR
tara:strand:- start:113 stop:673 length:561 start_codon:yes stop_codon:yes gene_type:complete